MTNDLITLIVQSMLIWARSVTWLTQKKHDHSNLTLGLENLHIFNRNINLRRCGAECIEPRVNYILFIELYCTDSLSVDQLFLVQLFSNTDSCLLARSIVLSKCDHNQLLTTYTIGFQQHRAYEYHFNNLMQSHYNLCTK